MDVIRKYAGVNYVMRHIVTFGLVVLYAMVFMYYATMTPFLNWRKTDNL